jgi:hypothetical protein
MISAMRTATIALLLLLAGGARAEEMTLTGRWTLSPELTHAEQPDGPETRSGLFSRMPRTSVSVGGVPLPGTGGGGDGLPPVSGNARDPEVLRCSELVIEPVGDDLRLTYVGVGSATLKRGNHLGLKSRWSDRRLTSRYQTTSRKVSQEYEVRRDGTLLVTVKLNPDESAAVVHKRVFERTGSP